MDFKKELEELEEQIEHKSDTKGDKTRLAGRLMLLMAKVQELEGEVPADVFEGVGSDFRRLAIMGLGFLLIQQMGEL